MTVNENVLHFTFLYNSYRSENFISDCIQFYYISNRGESFAIVSFTMYIIHTRDNPFFNFMFVLYFQEELLLEGPRL